MNIVQIVVTCWLINSNNLLYIVASSFLAEHTQVFNEENITLIALIYFHAEKHAPNYKTH